MAAPPVRARATHWSAPVTQSNLSLRVTDETTAELGSSGHQRARSVTGPGDDRARSSPAGPAYGDRTVRRRTSPSTAHPRPPTALAPAPTRCTRRLRGTTRRASAGRRGPGRRRSRPTSPSGRTRRDQDEHQCGCSRAEGTASPPPRRGRAPSVVHSSFRLRCRRLVTRPYPADVTAGTCPGERRVDLDEGLGSTIAGIRSGSPGGPPPPTRAARRPVVSGSGACGR